MTDAVPAARTCNGIQHIPFPAVADPDGGDWLRRISPRHDRDHKFSAGYPPFEEEGAVSWMGIFDAFCRKRIAISINLVRLRATGSRSPVRAHHTEGPPGSLDAVCALGPWDPARPAPAPRWGRQPAPGRRYRPSRFVISRFVTTQSSLLTMMVRSPSSAPGPGTHPRIDAASCSHQKLISKSIWVGYRAVFGFSRSINMRSMAKEGIKWRTD